MGILVGFVIYSVENKDLTEVFPVLRVSLTDELFILNVKDFTKGIY